MSLATILLCQFGAVLGFLFCVIVVDYIPDLIYEWNSTTWMGKLFFVSFCLGLTGLMIKLFGG